MVRKIGEHPTSREVYLRSLVARGVVTRPQADAMMEEFHRQLDATLRVVNSQPPKPSSMRAMWANYQKGSFEDAVTAVPEARLRELLLGLNRVPDGFQVHPKLRRLFRLREEQAAGEKPLDWAAGELLAYATLVTGGTRVRLSGQDVQRGTFSHRHAVVVDVADGREHVPLADLSPGQAPFSAYNSLLSEAGVLGFEYGYSLDYPDALVIWEAQFGDFANGAQVIIDNFIVSGETKWHRLSGVTMMLPHGYEGQGPEHSSARIERFLQMCAEDNIQVCNATTPAQLFHLLRRQALAPVRKPLVLFTPKSLLRHADAVSPIAELADGRFEAVLGDGEGRRRVVLCSGKVYYDLVAARGERRDVALVRVEQLYPFPLARLREELARHPGADVVWCQEEPRNMGPWPFVVLQCLDAGLAVRGVTRPASASTATGYPARHKREQDRILADALG